MNPDLHTMLADAPTEFKRIVADEAKGRATDELSRDLRSPQMLPVWRDALVELITDLNAQLTERTADWDAYRAEQRDIQEFRDEEARYRAWRGAAVRYQSRLLSRLREAKSLIKGHAATMVAQEAEAKEHRLDRIEAKLDALLERASIGGAR